MTATLHTLPTQAPHVVAAKDRIEAVRKVARDLYDARDEETNKLRDLHAFEGEFLASFKRVQTEQAKMRNDARRTWGEESCAYEALANLSYRDEADQLEAELTKFKLARDDFYNATLDDVAEAVEAAE